MPVELSTMQAITFSYGGGTSGTSAQITKWVEAHYTKVTIGGETVYDLSQPLS